MDNEPSPNAPDEELQDASASPDELEPMTFSTLGRFFAVPLLIIGSIMGGAVVVVLLFAAPSAPEGRSIESLLQALESGSGQRQMGMLLTKEKEHWQVALELSLRFADQGTEAELTAAELEKVAHRLSAVIRKELATLLAEGVSTRQGRIDGSKHLEFVIRALGRTESPIAVDGLLEVLQSGLEPYVAVAMRELGDLHGIPDTRRAIGPILDILERSGRSETRLIACTVLSLLGNPDDQRIIDALTAVRLTSEGEVGWSAALALARLGSVAGKSTLLDLMDRAFLSTGNRYEVVNAAGQVLRYPIPPQRVDELLIAAMEAASNLEDAEIWAMIAQLGSDPSPVVRGRAAEIVKARKGAA